MAVWREGGETGLFRICLDDLTRTSVVLARSDRHPSVPDWQKRTPEKMACSSGRRAGAGSTPL